MEAGLPLEIAEWLVKLELDGYAIDWTPHVLDRRDSAGLEGTQNLAFNPERGMGQGDIDSPFTWLSVFDVLLR